MYESRGSSSRRGFARLDQSRQRWTSGGQSRKEPSRQETVAELRRRKEKRQRQKLETISATRIQAAWRAFICIRVAKTKLRHDWTIRFGIRSDCFSTDDCSWFHMSRLIFFADARIEDDISALGTVCRVLVSIVRTHGPESIFLDNVQQLLQNEHAIHRITSTVGKCFEILAQEAHRRPQALLVKNDISSEPESVAVASLLHFVIALLDLSTWKEQYRKLVASSFTRPGVMKNNLSTLNQIVEQCLNAPENQRLEGTALERLIETIMSLTSESGSAGDMKTACGVFELLTLPFTTISQRLKFQCASLMPYCVPVLQCFTSDRETFWSVLIRSDSSQSFRQKAARFVSNLIKMDTEHLWQSDKFHVASNIAQFIVALIDYDLHSVDKELDTDGDIELVDDDSDAEEPEFPLSPVLRSSIEALHNSKGQDFLLSLAIHLLENTGNRESINTLSDLLYFTIRSHTHSSRRRMMLLSFALTGNFVSRLWREHICSIWTDPVLTTEGRRLEAVISPLAVLCEIYSSFLRTAGKREVCEKQIPLRLSDVYDADASAGGLIMVLKNSIWDVVWTNPRQILTGRTPLSLRQNLMSQFPKICGRLLTQLSENSSRWDIASPALFHIHIQYTQLAFFVEEAVSGYRLRTAEKETFEKERQPAVILKHAPCLIPFRERTQIFQALLDNEHMQQIPVSSHANSHPTIHAVIKRERVFEDGFEQLGKLDRQALRSKIRIQFVDEHGMMEAGVDGGGLFKDFLERLIKDGFHIDKGFFAMTDQNEIYPNPAAITLYPEAPDIFAFLGRMLGKAVYDGILVELPFAHFFLKKILRLTCDLHDMPSFDQEVYDSLIRLRSNDWNEKEIGLTFTITDNVRGMNEEVELKQNGRHIPVTHQNAVEYVFRFADYRLNMELKRTSQRFVDGFLEVIQPEWIELFNAAELRMVISGTTQKLNLDNLRQNTRYLGGYAADHPVVVRLWCVLDEFSSDEQGKFLKFVTGCSRAPLLGFQRLQPNLAIQRIASSPRDSDRLPTSATCMNLLKLPEYTSREILKEKLLYAISSNAGFNLS